MARSEKDQLIVELEARVRDFERGMQRAAGTADKQFGKINRSAKQSAMSMQKTMQGAVTRVNGVLSKLGIGAIAGGGFAGLLAGAQQAAASIAEIGRSARQAGLDTKSFQELGYVAKANRIEVESLAAGMRELSLRGSEFFTTGSGSAAEAFKELGYSADQVREKLKAPSQFLTEIIGKVQSLDKASQIRIFDQLFGGDGERFVRLIDQGADGIRATIQEAHNLGAVMSDDVIKKAEELDKKFNQIANTVGTALKIAIVEAAAELQKFIDQFRDFQNRATSTLEDRFSELQTRRGQLMKQRGTTEDKILSYIGKGAETELAAVDAEMAQVAAELRKRAIPKLRAELLADNAARNPPPTTPPPGKGGTASRDKAAEAAAREAEAVRKLIADLEHELSLVGSSNVERDIATTLRRANVDAASAEGRQIAELIRQIDAETEALEKAKQAKEELIQAGEAAFGMIGDALGSIADGSVKAEDAVKKLAIQLALAAAQAALLGSGPLAGLFGGGLFGGGLKIPGFASGTDYAPGGLAVVGEKGPELIQLPRGSKVFPNVPAVNGAGGGGAVNVTINQQIDASGADPAAIQRLEGGLMKMNRDLESRIVAGVRKAQKSNVKLG